MTVLSDGLHVCQCIGGLQHILDEVAIMYWYSTDGSTHISILASQCSRPSSFWPMSIVAKWSHISATAQQLFTVFTVRRNASIASAVLAVAIPSVCPSVHPSVTRRYCVQTTAHSTVQFTLSDSKMCLVL